MKKILVITFISFIFIRLENNTNIFAITSVNRCDKQTRFISDNIQVSIEESKEELYKKLFITLLYLHVQKAIDDYYDEYMTYLPREDPFSYKILNIEKSRSEIIPI